jgi:serine beta-lactamase-like protein LACTB
VTGPDTASLSPFEGSRFVIDKGTSPVKYECADFSAAGPTISVPVHAAHPRSTVSRPARHTQLLLALCLGCASPIASAGNGGGAPAAPFSSDEPCARNVDAVRAAVNDVVTRQGNIGMSVAISRTGRIVFSEGFGMADLENGVPATPRTRYSIASVTKAFTGVAVLKAVERGQLDLDAPIQTYVRDFPRKPGGEITARLLAAHLAGIRHWGTERSPSLYARHFDDVLDILPLFAADTLIAPPGTRYSYSSYGYDLLGAALQSAAGVRYQDAVVRDVITPLGLASTQFDDVRKVIPLRSRHYSFYDLDTFAELADPVRVPDWDYSHNMAAGNIISTAEDLTRFGEALTRPGLLSAGSLAALYTRPRVGQVRSPMSFGWFVSAEGESPRRINIGGSNAGVQSGLFVYPDERFVIALISNTWGRGSRSGELTGSGPTDLPGRIAAACLR